MEHNWIFKHCNKEENKLLCLIEEEYINDDFNMTGLEGAVKDYDYALDLILNNKIPIRVWKYRKNSITESAKILYGLVHARYILTEYGLEKMLEKISLGYFDLCPRVRCNRQIMLPVGESDTYGHGHVKFFCPKCQDIYFPINNILFDGSYFGTTFPHLLFLIYPDIISPSLTPTSLTPTSTPSSPYTPHIYGFKIHKSVK